MQLVETVASNAKFHSSQDRTNQSTVTIVFQSINQHLEEAQVVEDLAVEVATEEALTEDHEKCTKQLVETVVRTVKFHSSQNKTSQSIVTNVSQTINRKAEEAQVVEVAAEVATEEALTEDHEKCTKRLVEIVVKIVKFHSSQNRTSQSTAANAFKVIKEIKDN